MISFAVIQDQFKVFKETPLHGSYEKHSDLKFNIGKWWTGEFQEKKEAYLGQNFGLRNFFVRFHNQIMFSVFKHGSANQVIVGKDNYLFEENYLKAVNGQDFIGVDSINNQVERLKSIGDSLKSYGVELVVVLAPGKGSYYPEYNSTNEVSKVTTNYKEFSKRLTEQQLNVLDFNKWFVELKDTVSFPLIPKTGIHWSKYGEYLAADSLIKYLEHLKKNNYADLIIEDFIVGDSVSKDDRDIEFGMNLLYDIENVAMAYPQFSVSESQAKPNVLLISDSFYWGMFNFGLSSKVFNNSEFWYYYQQVYPQSFEKELLVSDVDVLKKLKQQDVIIIMCTEANLHKFSFGFIEDVYGQFNNAEKIAAIKLAREQKVQGFVDAINKSPEWLNDIRNKIKGTDKTLDEAVLEDAKYMVWQEENNNKK